MHRRDALKQIALASAGAAFSPPWVERLAALAVERAAHCQDPASDSAWRAQLLNAHQNETVIVLTELIIPQTDTAGARAARVNEVIDTVLADAREQERTAFLDGLAWIDGRARELFGADFITSMPDQQTALLTILSSPHNRSLADQPGVAFFEAIKRLTITGYYTSQVGMKEELDDDGTRFFAGYDGCTHGQHQE